MLLDFLLSEGTRLVCFYCLCFRHVIYFCDCYFLSVAFIRVRMIFNLPVKLGRGSCQYDDKHVYELEREKNCFLVF